MAGFSCLLLSGCRGETGPRLFPVAGRVTLAGEPLATGAVTLRPESTRDGWEQPTGSIDEDGRYRVFTRERPGAPAGRYLVVVFSTAPTRDKDGAAHPGLPASQIPVRYSDPAQTPLRITVGDSTGPAFDLELNRDGTR